jgi:hypothetical protein
MAAGENISSNCVDHPILHGYNDIMDMSVHPFLSYNFILQVVDPMSHFGFAVVLHRGTINELNAGFDHLISTMHVHFQTIYYIDKASFTLECIKEHSSIDFIKLSHWMHTTTIGFMVQ